MSDYYPDHLELTPSPEKTMQFSTVSTNFTSMEKTISHLEAFQDAQSLTTIELSKRENLKNNGTTFGTQRHENVKRLTKRPIYQQKLKNVQKKGKFRQKDQLQLKIKNQQPKYQAQLHKKGLSTQQLQMRCLELDEQLKKLKLKQRRTTIKTSRAKNNNNQYLTKALLTLQDFGKKITTEMNSRSQIQNYNATQSCVTTSITLKSPDLRNSMQEKAQKNNHFFAKLKRKLNEEITKINQKNGESIAREISPGCEIKRANLSNSTNAFRTPLTHRSKAKTSLSRSGVCTTTRNSVQRKRHQSARQRVLQSKQLKYAIQKIQQQDNLELRGKKKEFKKHKKLSRTTSNVRYSEPQVNKTFRHVSPMYKQRHYSATKGEMHHQKMKEKVLNILVECDSESMKKQTIEQGINIFESYSKQITKKLAKKVQFLSDIQKTQLFDENEADEEYH